LSVQRELGLELEVHPVSVLGADESLLLRWLDCEISPLFERHRALAEASLRRKIACLSESVATSLEMLRHRGHAGEDRQVEVAISDVRRLLDGADDAVRRARQHVLDWSMGRERVFELILQFAAQAAMAGGDSSRASHDPLLHAARDILAQRAAMAHDLVATLHQALRGSLEGLRHAWPSTGGDIASRTGMKPAGLPIPDLDRFHSGSSKLRAWWASAFPGLAVRVARRRLDEQFGEALGTCVDTYDRQLQAWTKAEIEGLAERYELEAAPVREQVRRIVGDGASLAGFGDGEDRGMLEADLRELRGAGEREGGTAPFPTYSGETAGAKSAALESGMGSQ
jgi:hypothetical protein